jgi:hypothetical protein
MALNKNTTSLTSDLFQKKAQTALAKKAKEIPLPKKVSVSPAKGSTAITAKKRYVSPYSKKAVE